MMTALSSLIDSSLSRACAALLQYQTQDGHFFGDIDQGTAPTSQTLIVEKLLGVLDPDEAKEGARWLCGRMQQDGSFLAYPDALVTSMTEACCAYGALAATGLPVEDPKRRLLRSWINANGGFEAADPISKVYLVLAGVLSKDSLPKGRIEHVLVPGIERYIGRSFILFHGATLMYILPGLFFGLQRGEAPFGFVENAARQRIIEYLLERQNPEGNWAGSQWVTAMAVACLFVLGVPKSHDAIVRGLESLGRLKRKSSKGLEVISLNANVWNTAMALRVLGRAGFRGSWQEKAVDYLLTHQSSIPAPRDWTNASSLAPLSGGWSFEEGSLNSLDTDTTAMVLAALLDYRQSDRVRAALQRGEHWLLSMQNKDGGFAAFTRGQRTAPPGPLFRKKPEEPKGLLGMARFFLKPPFEFVDIPTADLTSRVVVALSKLGPQHRAPLSKAVRFLYSQQDGEKWWGRWTTNYLAATAFVLQGLQAAGEEMKSQAVRRAVRWVLAHQNQDGGFGEANESYANPSLAGQGPSNAYLTGLVLHALCSAEEAQSEAAQRAAGYLCASQNAQGLWEEHQAVQTMAPELDLFYKNFVNFQTAPIEALAVYRETL